MAAVDEQTLDVAIGRLLQRFQEEDIVNLVESDGELWDALPWQDRLGFGFFKRDIADVLREISAFHVVASLQRIRPELVSVIGTPQGLGWLGRQVASLKLRALSDGSG